MQFFSFLLATYDQGMKKLKKFLDNINNQSVLERSATLSMLDLEGGDEEAEEDLGSLNEKQGAIQGECYDVNQSK